jgi:acetoin utilization deacetylase AcuC-like enzyme
VLEGGYSDRALTSAAMGHTIGMLNKGGQDAWWSELELINVSFNLNVHTRGNADIVSSSKKLVKREEMGN